MYACMTPMSRPNACITTGKNSGATPSSSAAMTVPLMTLPKSRTASASVRESSPMIVKGQHHHRRLHVLPEVAPQPLRRMPKTGTATNTQSASAAVVESDPVGGR
jgi:hypothetical protein